MARTPENDFAGQTDSAEDNSTIINADGQDIVQIPDNAFIADAEMSRDGQNLTFETPNGETLTIEGYFNSTPAIESPSGAMLTGDLVNSFLQSPQEYASNSSANDESPVGAVEEVSGDATVIRADGTSEPITLGTPIYQGDVIETSTDGAVNITFIDETSMAVSKDARLSVDEYQFDTSTESGVTNFSVLRGVFMFTSGLIGRDDPDDVQIDTPVGSIGIRGTIIAGNINPGADSEITVVEGAIVVRNGAMEKTLSQQFESIKLGGFNDGMEDLGVVSATNVSETYGSVGDVVPKLFSSINDAAAEEAQIQHAEEQAAKESAEAEAAAEAAAEAELKAAEEVLEEQVEEPAQDPELNLLNENGLDPAFGDNRADGYQNDRPNASDKPRVDHKKYDYKGPQQRGEELHYTQGQDDGPRMHFVEKTVFEYAKIGTVVAKVWISNAPAGAVFDSSTFTITGNGNSHFTLHHTTGENFAEIRLSAAGFGAANNPAGISLNSANIHAAFNGETLNWIITPTTVDAAVHVSADSGLDYDVISATAPTSQNAGDVNGNGINNTVNLDANDQIVINGAGGNTISGHTYTSVAAVGDIDNDGYADIVGGIAGTGQTTAILGNGSNTTSSIIGDGFGTAVAGLGDFDGDGKSDYAVSAPGTNGNDGQVYIKNLSGGVVTINGQAGIGAKLGELLSSVGDVNGDGLSDLLMSHGSNEAYVVFGGSSTISDVSGMSGAEGFKISGLNGLKALGSAGDINGDGFDDFAISDVNGSDVNTYIVYGNGSPSDINLAHIENPENALKIHHAGANSANGYQITALGDLNDDGFDDVQVGVAGGEQFIVYGEMGGLNTPYVTDGAQNDAHGVGATGNSNDGVTSDANGYIKATANGQALIGEDALGFDDNGYDNLSMKGGDENSNFIVSDNEFRKIDGGAGNEDTIRFSTGGATLDFSAIDFEAIEQIEILEISQNSQIIELTIENIFNLLKSSDNGSLTIQQDSPTDGILKVSGTITTSGVEATDAEKIREYLDKADNGTDDGDVTLTTSGGVHHYQIGGYNLYIDNVAVETAA